MQQASYRVLLTTVLILIVALIVGVDQQLSQAQGNQLCFSQTGYCIAGRFREYWESNGGLPIFGYPIGRQYEETVEGKAYQVQWFERIRFELHLENSPPYDVLLGRIGDDRLHQQGKDWSTFPTSQPTPGCQYFTQTKHNVCGRFLDRWQSNGLEFDGNPSKSESESLALLGLPLSDLTTLRIEGTPYTVQWFERARFELHPTNSPPYDVLLGRLGVEVHDNPTEGSTPTSAALTATPVPTPTTKPYPYPYP
ncbi:MAG: hypothetical protein HGA19_17995 [Oscillochloris sp.]|nr:hypothetical protein [Oscillochloris sp.]